MWQPFKGTVCMYISYRRKADFLSSNQTSDSEDSDLDDEDISECMKYHIDYKQLLKLCILL